jgi:hypothetical protein
MIPFFAFALGSGLDLAKVWQAGLLGLAQLPTALRREAMSESMSGWIAVICSSSARSN